MKCFDKIQDVHATIFNDAKFESISNELYVWQENKNYHIEEEKNAKKEWKMYLDKDVVRAMRILNRENLINSPFYKIFVGKDFLRIDVDKNVNIHSVINNDYKAVIKTVNKIQRLLFCKSKIEEVDLTNSEIAIKIWIYPMSKIDGLSIYADNRMNRLLREIVDFAKLNSIEIKLGADERNFFNNPEVKKKLAWEDYLFDYHTGVCFIFSDGYTHTPFIKKVPDICWKNRKKLEFNISDKEHYYLNLGYGFDGFDEWKVAISTFIKEQTEYFDNNKEELGDNLSNIESARRPSNNRWESISFNPHYNADIDMDQQTPEFWDSL